MAGGVLWFAQRAHAQVNMGDQLPQTRLLSLTPAGAKQGAIVEVTFRGTDVEDPEAMIFSHPGIKAEPIVPPAPPIDPKKPPKEPPAPLPVTKFKVTVAGDVPAGMYDCRMVNRWGVSNPRRFVIGTAPEVDEKEPNNDIEQAQKIELGNVINGVVQAATDVDYYAFTGKKGQRILAYCQAGTIDSRLEAEMGVYSTNGRLLAYSRPSPGQEALCDVVLPADADYYIRLCQFTYTKGDADYFYRLSVATMPWVDAVFPPMVEPGKSASITLYGRNLPGGTLDPMSMLNGKPVEKVTVNVTAPNTPDVLAYSGQLPPTQGLLDGFEHRVPGSPLASLLTFAQAPVVLENDANDKLESAQEVKLPCEIAGRIDKMRDRDWYKFTAKKGEVYVIEVLSDRLGAPTDMYIQLKNEKNNINQGDDDATTLSPKGFYTPSRDPAPIQFTVPEDGTYFLLVGSHMGDVMSGVNHVYRVRITPPQPDFRLVIMPSDEYRPDACTVGQACDQSYALFVQRRDGFTGDIALSVEGLPNGVTCAPQSIGPKMNQGFLVLSAAANAAVSTGALKVKGTATINGKTVVREARPATITWPGVQQQNVPTITRLDRQLMLAVREKAPYRVTVSLDKGVVQHGETVNATFKLERHWPDFKEKVTITQIGSDFPQTFKFGNIDLTGGDAKLAIPIPNTVQPGSYTLVFRNSSKVNFVRTPKAKPVANVNLVRPSAPVQLTILPKEVGKLNVANSTVKVGMQGEVTVAVQRLYDYAGPFKVQLILNNEKGLTVNEAIIPAGQNDVKLIVQAANDANPGNRANLVVRAVATVNGNVDLTHEAKFNLSVVK